MIKEAEVKDKSYKFGQNNAVVFNGKKKKSFSFKNLNITNMVSITFILLISANIINSISVELKLNKQSKILHEQHKIIKNEHHKLKEKIAYYKSNSGIEKLARERLGYIKKDEIPIKYINKN